MQVIKLSETKGFFRFLFNKRTEFFLHMLILENEAQIETKNYRTMLFMSKQVGLPKISLMLQKVKNWPKTDIHVRPFCMKAFNLK